MIFPKPDRHAVTVCHGKISKQMICRVSYDMQTSIGVGRSVIVGAWTSSSVINKTDMNKDRWEENKRVYNK
jgi:hypothetical protein